MTETALCPAANYDVSISTTSANKLLGTDILGVRLMTTAACRIVIAPTSAPTAVTTDMPLPANVPEYFNLTAYYGKPVYIAAITATGTGTLSCTVMK